MHAEIERTFQELEKDGVFGLGNCITMLTCLSTLWVDEPVERLLMLERLGSYSGRPEFNRPTTALHKYVVAHTCHAQILYEAKEVGEAAVVVQSILDTLALPVTQWPSKYLGSKVRDFFTTYLCVLERRWPDSTAV
jgi:hypothetical protein